MKLLLATVSGRRSGATGPAAEMLQGYVSRASRLMACSYRNFGSEEELLLYARSTAGRTTPVLLLTDREGLQLSSEEIAEVIHCARDSGKQHLMVAIGPADAGDDRIPLL